MTEPVGSQPRRTPKEGDSMPAIPGNSHKVRAAAEADVVAEADTREKEEKLVEGKVVTRKIPWWKRFASSMVADDAQSVGDYILTDVLIPSAKNLISDIIGQGTNRVLFGTSSRLRRPGFGSTSLKHTPYERFSSIDREPPRRPALSQVARATHDFEEVVLETREDAIIVIEALVNRIARYQAATVSDLYDILGVTGSYVDKQWGWTDLITADVRQVRGGFLLDLPRPEPIR